MKVSTSQGSEDEKVKEEVFNSIMDKIRQAFVNGKIVSINVEFGIHTIGRKPGELWTGPDGSNVITIAIAP